MTLDTQLASHTFGTQDHFCLNPKLVLSLLPPAAFERGQDKLGIADATEMQLEGSRKFSERVVRLSGRARNKRVKRGTTPWSTVSKPTGRTQMGRTQQLGVGSPRSPELVLPPTPTPVAYAFLLSVTPAALAFLCPSGKYTVY